MAATIKIKNSSTASAVPTSSDLVQGELAVNVTDKRVFTENASGTVVELGTNPSILTLPDGSASAPTLTNDGDTNTGIFFPAADTVGITTGGTERARVDSSGNLGLGVTPSAWDSTYKALQVGARSMFYGIGSEANMANNAYYNSGYKYVASSAAGLYTIDANVHKWYNAASGTAGNAISFTQAMTLDASGNLGIGATSPAGKLDIRSSGLSGTDKIILQITDNTNTTFQINQTTSYSQIMANNVLTFSNGTTERARIDSSGNLLVGATSGSGNNERVNITTNTNQTLRLNNTNATSGNISMVSILGANTDNTSSYHLLTSTNGATRFYVYGNGTSGNASDQNLKKNIETTRDGYIEDLCRLRVVKYNWNDQEEGSPKELGWIAQEVEQVFPGLVQDGVPNENGDTFKEVKTSVLPFMLLKALQELKAEFDAYKASHH